MRKRILVLTNNSDGLYGFRKELLAALTEHGEIYASTPNDGYFEELSASGCHIIETPIDRRGINPWMDFSLLVHYFRMMKDLQPDLVITYTIKPNIYGGVACRLLGIPYEANITGLGTAFQKQGVLRKLVTLLYKVGLKKAKTVFFENSENMKTLLNEGVVALQQCCLLPGAGVNLEHYTLAPYPVDDEETRFLFVGRVMQEKGIDELFRAMRILRKNGVQCSLDVLGRYEENYEPLIRQYEAEGWLHYHGYQKDVRPFIANCHCFVLPSWHEGMANTNLESAAMGRPVITSNIHGCLEAVINGESGLLCEPKNVQSLYETMKHFCDIPWEEKKKMGLEGRKHMEDVFDKTMVVKNTIERIMQEATQC